MAIDEAARAWVVRLASGATDRSDMAALDRWLQQSAAHRAAFDDARETWAMSGLLEREFAAPGPAVAGHRGWRRRRVAALAVAAMIAVAVVLPVFEDLAVSARSDARTAIGEQKVATLPDGSRVHLNTDSAIAVDYAGRERRIALLRGEAYFEVAADPDRPFMVAALDGVTRAVGTAFVVREMAGRVEVAVAEGRVRVTSPELAPDPEGHGAAGASGIELAAGERGGYDSGGPPRRSAVPGPGTIAAWRSGRIVIDGLPLEAALAELDRYHPGRIVLTRGDAAGRLVSGVFATAAIGNAVTALAETQGLRVLRLTDYLLILR